METAREMAQSNVVRLAEYRKRQRPVALPRSRPAGRGAQYYCMRCDADEFRLYSSGNVHCARCGAFMRNLALTTAEEEA